MYRLSNRSKKRLDGINSVLLAIITEGIKDSPHDFGIPRNGGLRSAEDQFFLYKKGVSKCDGYKNKSYHQSGNAFDIYIYENGNVNWDIKKLTEVAEHLISVAKSKFNTKLEWGGNWRSWKDYPHFQIKIK